jgi:DNA-binding winged helix-turn-helix (wHTH) protein/tetratricopeptide (TPR) repeat protein
MADLGNFLFPPFQLDVTNGLLWRETTVLPLRPKTFAVLRYLVEHAGQVVSRTKLSQAGWGTTKVSAQVLRVSIRELRHVLGDPAQQPQVIETVGQQGWRFIAPIIATPPVSSFRFQVSSFKSPLAPSPQPLTPVLVGREAELAQLHRHLEKAALGERQLVFITGEAGIGKTTVIDTFLACLTTEQTIWIARGQCIEHSGAGEPYMPVLAALEQLCRTARDPSLLALLRRCAPLWLVQMPALLSPEERGTLQRELHGTTQERMLREMTALLQTLTAETSLVLWLEDLHWSDPSTLHLLATLARQREAARLLLIGTYRPVEVLANGHPLRAVQQELRGHRLCTELPLAWLTEAAVEEYLTVRFNGEPLLSASSPLGVEYSLSSPLPAPLPLQELARVLHQRTEGNPLSLVTVVDDLVAQGVIGRVDGHWTLQGGLKAVTVGVPESVRQLIEQQLGQLPSKDQQVLAAASVAGAEFSAAAVATALETDGEQVEDCCDELVRRQLFLEARGQGVVSDRRRATRYGFRHALYREVVYAQVTPGRRARLHRRIGAWAEGAYGDRVKEIATELALHFEQGRDYQRAVHYLRQAAETALKRSANTEAIAHLTKGLELLKTLPDTPERIQQEFTLQTALGVPLLMTKGYAAPEVERTYTRARELCQQMGETPQLFLVLRGLCALYFVQGKLQKAHELTGQLLSLAQRRQNPTLLVEAHYGRGIGLCAFGEFLSAREHLEQGIAFYDPQKHRSLAFLYGHDPKMICLSVVAHTLWVLGYPEQALKRMDEGLALAQDLSLPYNRVGALLHAAQLYQHLREGQLAQARAEGAIALSTEQGFGLVLALGKVWRGWALAEQGQGEEGASQIRQGLDACWALGSGLWRPHHLVMLAEAYGKTGKTEEGLSVLTEALAIVDKNGERPYEAELYRLKGQLTLQEFQVPGSKFQGQESPKSEVRSPESEVEECFLRAIEIARQQQAKSLELRATMSLARLWQSQGKTKRAHKMLVEIYGWFTEGFDTKDLQEAKALLDGLR